MDPNPYGSTIGSEMSKRHSSNKWSKNSFQASQSDDFAAESNSLRRKNKSYHFRSLAANIILFIGQIVIVAQYSSGDLQVTKGEAYGICFGIYVFYLLLGLGFNPLLSYLSNVEHGSSFENEYNNVRNMTGYFQFHAECYHFQTKDHIRKVKDANGRVKTETYTTKEKVVTHTANENVDPRSTFDDSGTVDQVQASTDVIFVRMNVNYRFKDQKSRRTFQNRWEHFTNVNRLDLYQDFNHNYHLPTLKERMSFYVGAGEENYRTILIAFSFFGFIWPVSMYIEGKISRFHLSFMKILTM